jgi:hypothetical protein
VVAAAVVEMVVQEMLVIMEQQELQETLVQLDLLVVLVLLVLLETLLQDKQAELHPLETLRRQ